MEQAKKRDRKIMITDVAIDKIGLVNVKEFSCLQNQLLRQEHKTVLQLAKLKNASNEVLSISSNDFTKRVYTFGSEFGVDPNENIAAILLINTATPRSLVFVHNHPSTNLFSTTDITAFISDGRIGTMSVITNQGEVYILHKTVSYDYNKIKALYADILYDYSDNKFDGNEIVKRFIKVCSIGGVDYERST